ncbi:exonuclease GOR-like [Choristoneura fumiferana]|uniref:exonuclease GOR-like n=1 Tax=Choristoneura fumiferana TaxID=7141 RepID=UPI003D1557E8
MNTRNSSQPVLPASTPSSLEPQQCCEDQLTKALRRLLLKPEQMLALGYPMRQESQTYFYINSPPKSTKKTRPKASLNVPKLVPSCFQGDEKNIRSCDRCQQHFNISKRNFNLSDNCVHHWGRKEGPFGHRRYSCCNAPVEHKGCTMGQYHVHRNTLPGYNGSLEGYVQARFSRGGIYALDAEMIYTTGGMELARIALVDASGNPVYDTLVKPCSEILDCNTFFSGISPEDMSTAVKTLKDVQRDILQFIGYDTILIGHALENDLRALKLVHGAIVDTCVLYPDRRGLPYKRALRFLTKEYLGREIQQGQKGHAPVEDARAALELAFLAIKKCSSS